MGRRLLPLVLVLALMPATAAAFDEEDPFADDFGDDEYKPPADTAEAPDPAPAPAEPEAKPAPEEPAPAPAAATEAPAPRSEPARSSYEDDGRYERERRRDPEERYERRGPPETSRYVEEPRYREDPDYAPAQGSVSLELGGGLMSLGGYAFPKIPFSGSPDNAFHAYGLGGAFRLHYDFPAMDFDWRVALNGALPGYMGLRGTVGIAKDLSPVEVPRFVARGGVGIELMFAHLGGQATFLVPNFVGEGEVALEFSPARQFTLGFVISLGIRYGLPLGFGFDVVGYLPRLTYSF